MKIIDYLKRIFNHKTNQQLLNAPKTRYEELVDSIDFLELSKIFINGITPDVTKTIPRYGSNPYEYPLQTKITTDHTIEIIQEFFESIDENMLKRVSEVIDGKNPEIKLNAEKYNGKGAEVSNPNQKPIIIYVPIRGDIRQLYEAVHEFTHIMDIDNGDTETRRVLGEVAPQCMERMLDDFLLGMSDSEMKKYRFDRNTIETDIKDRRIGTFISRYHDVEKINNGKDIEKHSRYMLAQIYSTHFNNLDKGEKKSRLVSFIESVKNDDFYKANSCFGLSMNKNQKLQRELYVKNTISEVSNLIAPKNRSGISKQKSIDLSRDDIS